jgi:hypothetical protein
MPTSKKPDPPNTSEKPRAERGRYARLLVDGYVVEIAPAPPSRQKAAAPVARPVTPTK